MKKILVLFLLFMPALAWATKKDILLGEGFLSSVRKPVFFVTNTSTASSVQATSTLIVNRTTSTFESGRAFIDSAGNMSVSGTFQAYGAATFLGGLTVTGGCVGCGGTIGVSPFSPTSSFTSEITVTNGFSTSSFGADHLAINTTTNRVSGTFYVDYSGNISSSGTLLEMKGANAIVSSTSGRFQNLNVSSTFFSACNVFSITTSTICGTLHIAGDTRVSSTFQSTGNAIFYGGIGVLNTHDTVINGRLRLNGQAFLNINGSLFLGSSSQYGATGVPVNGDIIAFGSPLYFAPRNSGEVGAAMIDNANGDNKNVYFGIGDRAPTDRLVIYDGALRVGDGVASTTVSGTLFVFASSTSNRAGLFRMDENANISSSGTLFVMAANNAIVSSTFGRFQTLNVSSSLFLAGNALTITSSTIGGTLTVSGGLFASSTLQVTGQSIFYGNIVGTTTLAGTGVYISASTSHSGSLTTAGLFQASSTLQSSGLATLYSGFQSLASSTVGAALTVTGALQASSTLQISGATRFYGDIVGTTTLAGTGVYISASTSHSGVLTTANLFQASSTLQVSGLATLYNGFISNASSSFTSNAQVAGNLSVSTSLFVSSSLFLGQFPGRPSGVFQVDNLGSIYTSGTINFTTTTATSGYIVANGRPVFQNFGFFNTFVGEDAGNLTLTGGNNVGLGYLALSGITSGNNNLAIGSLALVLNTTGFDNMGIGGASLNQNVDGQGNTAVGTNALLVSTSSFNTAIGSYSLQALTGGATNTAVGYQALFNVTDGKANVGIGARAGNLNTTGASNTYIGTEAGFIAGGNNLNNSAAIGFNSQVFRSNFISLGSVNGDAVTVGVGVSASNPTGLFNINPTGSIHTSSTLNFEGGFDRQGTRGATVSSSASALSIVSRAWVVSTTGDILFNSSTQGGGGPVLRATNAANTCFRVQVNSAGTLSTASVTCPSGN